MAVSSYLSHGFTIDGLSEHVASTIQRLNTIGDFDGIAVRGVSGLLVGAIVAHTLKKHLIVVRKEVSTHASNKVETHIGVGNYVIIDDMKASGLTIRTIKEEITKLHPSLVHMGTYLYKTCCWEKAPCESSSSKTKSTDIQEIKYLPPSETVTPLPSLGVSLKPSYYTTGPVSYYSSTMTWRDSMKIPTPPTETPEPPSSSG